jgi:thiamine-monophosphate kinase
MSLSEFSIIERYFTRPSCRGDVVLGVGDDAALMQVPHGMQLAASVDTLVAGHHFPADTDPEAIGYKSLAVNLSDMAAMGAKPAWVTLSLALPDSDEAFIEGFAKGFFALAQEYEVELVGGDTVRGPLTCTVQINGIVPPGSALLRSGAQTGDFIYVTGSLGDAGAGLHLKQGGHCRDETAAASLIRRLEYPQPRVAEGLSLRGIASSAIDISDGLLADLNHILENSGCGAALQLDAIPRSTALQECIDDEVEGLRLALGAGDDYELCFTVPPHKVAELERISANWACEVTRIGEITEGTGIALSGSHAERMRDTATGFDHFLEE